MNRILCHLLFLLMTSISITCHGLTIINQSASMQRIDVNNTDGNPIAMVWIEAQNKVPFVVDKKDPVDILIAEKPFAEVSPVGCTIEIYNNKDNLQFVCSTACAVSDCPDTLSPPNTKQ